MRLEKARAELKKLRKELEFIDGQLDNEMLLESCDCGELSLSDIAKFRFNNEKLMTEVILLETMLEC